MINLERSQNNSLLYILFCSARIFTKIFGNFFCSVSGLKSIQDISLFDPFLLQHFPTLRIGKSPKATLIFSLPQRKRSKNIWVWVCKVDCLLWQLHSYGHKCPELNYLVYHFIASVLNHGSCLRQFWNLPHVIFRLLCSSVKCQWKSVSEIRWTYSDPKETILSL